MTRPDREVYEGMLLLVTEAARRKATAYLIDAAAEGDGDCAMDKAEDVSDIRPIVQALCDPENQPHQWLGDPNELQGHLDVALEQMAKQIREIKEASDDQYT